MNQRIKQKIENAGAADYERRRGFDGSWTLAKCKMRMVAMYGPDAESIIHDYFVRLFGIVETPATRRDDTIDSLREYWAREGYEVLADDVDLERQLAPAISDRSNKE